MGTGISLLLSCWNRTALFRLSYPTWLMGNEEYPIRTLPDEILIINDSGATDLVDAVRDMETLIEKLEYDIPVIYKHRSKGHSAWSNPAIPHNYLVKQAKGPVVLILDPEVAFVNDVLGYIHSYYLNPDHDGPDADLTLAERRRNSLSAGTTYAIQNEFMHAAGGIPAHKLPYHKEYISTDPTSHQVILRGGPAHECRAWWRTRYIELGGKDERYIAWGYEDLDMEHRNVRAGKGGRSAVDSRMHIITYGHGLPPNVTGSESTGKNEQLWRCESPPDGIANKGKEWGQIS